MTGPTVDNGLDLFPGKRKTKESMDVTLNEAPDEGKLTPSLNGEMSDANGPMRSFSHKLRRKNVITDNLSGHPEEPSEKWQQPTPKDDQTQQFLVDSLRNCYLFQSQSKEGIISIVNAMKKRELKAKEVVFRQGDPGYYFYFVETGILKVYKDQGKGREDRSRSATSIPLGSPSGQLPQIPLNNPDMPTEDDLDFDLTNQLKIRTYTTGEWFGELSLLFLSTRAASVVAETSCVLWMIDRSTFKYSCQTNWESNFEITTKALRTVPLLDVLSDEQLKDIAQVARFEDHRVGDTVIEAGTRGDTFYIVKAGSLLVKTEGNDNQTTLRANNFFGELSLLRDQPRAATVTALEDVTLICIDKSTFINILGPLRQIIDDNIRAFALQDVDVFRDLTTEKRVEMFKLFKEQKFVVGDHIITEGDNGNTFYVIRFGAARVSKRVLATNDIAHLKDLGVGDYFGEMALIYDQPRQATVTCIEDCSCFVMGREDFASLAGPMLDIIKKGAEARQTDNYLKEQGLKKQKREMEIKHLLEQVNNNAVVNPVNNQYPSQVPMQMAQQQQQQQQYLNLAQQRATSNTGIYQQQQQPPYYPYSQASHQYSASQMQQMYLQQQQQLAETMRQFFLKDFQSKCTLGTGTFGRVKLVVHMPTGTTYALKIQSKYQIMKFNLRNNIFNEKFVLSKMSHPFIVKLYQTFQDDDCLYMLLELVQGGELFSLLKNFGTKLHQAHHVFYVSCVVSAFEALHFHDILYRDLKPENLMIDALGYLKLVDFGFAKHVTRRTFTLCGTPEYFSPELISGRGYGKGNDVWALGILAYEILSGYTPFGRHDHSQTEICKRIVRSRLYFPRDCSDQIGMQLIARLLDKSEPTRFGCDRNGVGGIKRHPWFSGLNWSMLLNQQIRSPWTPRLDSSTDSSNFDTYEEKHKLMPFRCEPDNDPFKGF